MKTQIMQWNDLHLVMTVCREGSLSAAARATGVNHSTVFRRIRAIEGKLGVRLFERLPSGYAMTEAGEAMLVSGERVENEILGLSRKLVGRDLHLSGSLRLAVPDALLMKILMPYLNKFTQIYPDIRLELSVSNNYLNLTKREADIAVRATRSPSDTAVGRRICSMATAIYGSAEYLRKRNDRKSGEELENHTWLMPDDSLSHLPVVNWLGRKYPQAPIALRCNNLPGLYEAAVQGLGIAALPCFLADPDNRLDPILPPVEALSSEIWLLTHQDLRKTARVRVMMDFLADALGKEKYLLEGRSVFP